MHRVFLLSPANSGGARARLIFSPRAGFALAQHLQRGGTAPIGEIFSFLSGLYFRGKLAYAAAFARPPPGTAGSWVITSNRGLLESATPLRLEELRALGTVPIDADEPRYRRPLRRSLRSLARSPDCEFVLLGSISTAKYAAPLLEVLGERVFFPRDFVGRGDMSRGGLLLRSVRDSQELDYVRLAGAVRRGSRPPRLEACSWTNTPFDLRPARVSEAKS